MRAFLRRKERFHPGHAYQKIVSSQEDIIGLFAYGFYEQAKILWLRSFSEKFGKDADEAEVAKWDADHLTRENIEEYRKRAYSVVEVYREIEKQRAKQELLQEYKDDVHDHIAATREKLEALTGVKGFFANLVTGQISSLLSALIAALFSAWIASLWFSALPLPGLTSRPEGGASRSTRLQSQSETVAKPSTTKR